MAVELEQPTLYAHYEGADELPRVPRPLWWRLVRILQAREGQTWLHPCAARMARHLTHHADERGSVTEVRTKVLPAYAEYHGVSERTAWTDFMRLVRVGLVRQVRAAAPGYQARYTLAMDLAALPDDLPADLAAELRNHIDNPKAAVRGRATRADIDAGLTECELVRYGSATRPEPITARVGCGRLHTSPYTREGSLPPQLPPPSQQSHRPRRPAFGGKDRDEEEASALYFVTELAPEWARQRGGEALTGAETVEIARLVVLLLRNMPENEVAELLTDRIGSAGDLARVLRWRIGRTLAGLRRSARRARRLQVDNDGSRHAAWLAANAERNAANTARRAELVELARRRAREIADARSQTTQARLEARANTASDQAAHDRPSRPHSPSRGSRPGEALIARTRPSGGLTEPETVFRREVLDRHRLPSETSPASGTGPGSDEADVDQAAIAADRAWLAQMMAERMATRTRSGS